MQTENSKDMILDFIDEQKRQDSNCQKRLSIESLRDESQINFSDILQRQWTETKKSQTFFHSQHFMGQQMHPQLIDENKMPSMKSRGTHDFQSKQLKDVSGQIEMKSIFTIFDSPEQMEDIEMFLSSQTFSMFIRLIVIINFVGLLLTEYNFRLDEANGLKTSISLQNAISLNFQLFANCVFTIEIILLLFSSRPICSDPWILLNIVGTLACWATIFFDMIHNDSLELFQILHIIRFIRGIRIIQVFQSLKELFETFLGTLPSLSKVFFPLLVFMSFYAITGQQLFLGANEFKCRVTPHPVNGVWPEVNTNLCGASFWQCPADSYCGNPYNYGLPADPKEESRLFQRGLVGFDNFFRALLTVYHYVFLSNWTGIIFKFSRYISPYLTTFYFVSMAVVLFFILANLIFISLSKAYLQKEKLLQKQRENSFNTVQEQNQSQTQLQQTQTQRQKYVLKIVEIFQIVLVITQSVVIVIDYKNMPQQLKDYLSLVDFITTIVAITVVIIRVSILRFKFVKSFHNFVDIIMILCFFADVIYCLSSNYSIVYVKTGVSAALRGIKIIRIIKILYVSEQLFKYQRNIVNLFFQTLKNMRYFLLMLSCIVLTFSFIGEMLFAFRVRFDINKQVDIKQGIPYVTNFESAYKSIISIVILFENQRWTETLYSYYYARGFWAVLFFASVAFVVHLMLTRLFMAVFLCYFRRNLDKEVQEKKKTKQQLQQQSFKDLDVQQNQQNNLQPSIINHLSQRQSNSSKQSSIRSAKHISGNQINSPHNKEDQKLFWVLDRNSCFLQIVKIFHNSKAFYYFVLAAIGLHVLSIVFRSNVDSAQKTRVLDSIEGISIVVYFLEFGVGVLSYGFYFETNSYLRRTHFNKVNFVVILLLIVSVMPFIDPLQQMIIRRLIVIKIFTILKTRNKEMDIILRSIAKISKNFLRVLVIYIFFLLMGAVIPLKLLKNSLYNCNNYQLLEGATISSMFNPVNCMNAGGDWVEDPQNFNNIFNAVVLMYQIVTSESWTYFIELTIFKDKHWDIFFVLMFFFYNVCLLNIFVGLIVETYAELKDEAYNLNLLRPSQRGWILIKNCINELVPTPTIGFTKVRGFVHEISFKIISHEYYSNAIDALAYVNILLYAMTIYRSSDGYSNILLYFKIAILLIFAFDTVIKLYALRQEYFLLDNSKVELIGFIYIVFYAIINTISLTNQQQRIVMFFLVVFLFLRCKKFLFRFTWSKTLINSVIEILPKCLQIGSFLFIVLFVYVAIGLEVFKHVKPSSKADNYTTGFNNFYTGLMTLVKIASNESWFEQVTTYLRGMQPNDVCYQINGQQDSINYRGMGCGNYLAIPFFLSYHMTMALLILNLLIATMVSAYDQNYEKEYNSVNVFQLQDCLQLWKKYDPKGTGVIPYKKFWRLSSQIGILFGISKKKLIKSKQKFLQELDIPICQSINPQDTGVLCYRFHDVITKFSKIKLQVSLDKGDENSQVFQFDIHPRIQNELKDYTIKIPQELYKNYHQFKNYKSGEMKYFFGLLRKMRSWKTHSKSKGEVKVSKLNRIIKVAMEKKVQEENLKNLLAFVINDHKELLQNRTPASISKQKLLSKQNIHQQISSDQSQSDLVQFDQAEHEEDVQEMPNQLVIRNIHTKKKKNDHNSIKESQ